MSVHCRKKGFKIHPDRVLFINCKGVKQLVCVEFPYPCHVASACSKISYVLRITCFVFPHWIINVQVLIPTQSSQSTGLKVYVRHQEFRVSKHEIKVLDI